MLSNTYIQRLPSFLPDTSGRSLMFGPKDIYIYISFPTSPRTKLNLVLDLIEYWFLHDHTQ